MKDINNQKDYIATKLYIPNSLNVQYIVTVLENKRPVSFCLRDAMGTMDKTELKNILIDPIFRLGDSSYRFINAEVLNCNEPYEFHYSNVEIPLIDKQIVSVANSVIGMSNRLENPVLNSNQAERLMAITIKK